MKDIGLSFFLFDECHPDMSSAGTNMGYYTLKEWTRAGFDVFESDSLTLSEWADDELNPNEIVIFSSVRISGDQ